MKKVYIVRHGETDYNKQMKIQGRGIDAPLNDTGRLQAEALCNFFQTRTVDTIAVSSLQRTRQTVEPVSAMKNLEIQSFRDLDEMDFGEMEGSPVTDTESQVAQAKQKWASGEISFPVKGGESPKQVFDRASSCIEHIINQQTGKDMLFVLHGRLIRILLSGWLYKDISRMQKIHHANGAINVLQYNNGDYEPLLLHYTNHLNAQPEVS